LDPLIKSQRVWNLRRPYFSVFF